MTFISWRGAASAATHMRLGTKGHTGLRGPASLPARLLAHSSPAAQVSNRGSSSEVLRAQWLMVLQQCHRSLQHTLTTRLALADLGSCQVDAGQMSKLDVLNAPMAHARPKIWLNAQQSGSADGISTVC
jgi:hypothetical protein